MCAKLPLCKAPPLADTFDTDPPCNGFGQVFGNGNTDVVGGHLVIDPNADLTMGCDPDHEMPFEGDGVWMEVSAVMPDHGSLGLTAQAVEPDPNYSPLIVETDGMLKLAISPAGGIEAMRPYDPVAMRWWRMRPDRATDTLIAETSPDGITWSLLGTSDQSPPTIIRPQIAAARDGTDPGVAQVEGLDICPPGTRPPE